jgi:hypothetical protein
MAMDEHYSRVRAAVRELGCRDSLYVIWAYCQFLQFDGFQMPRDIEVCPEFLEDQFPQSLVAGFNLEQIAQEVIQHAGVEPRNGRTLRRWDILDGIINDLRAIDIEIYLSFGTLGQTRIIHRQFAWLLYRIRWQQIIRYYKLFNTPEIVAYTQQAAGLTLYEIYLFGMCFLGHYANEPRATRVIDVQIPGYTQEHVERFLAFTSLSRNDLADRLRAEHALDEGFGYRYSSLREFPLVRFSHLGQEEVACPLPTLLYWRFTTGLYYTLKDVSGFLTAFGSSFQRYVGEVLHQRITSPERAVLGEEEYQVGRDRKHTVDWVVQQGDEAALFIECKTKRLTWASKVALVDLTSFRADIDALAAAVVQVYKTISDYRAGRYPHLPFVAGRRVFPIIVTLEDWYLMGSELSGLVADCVKSKMARIGLSEAWLEEMPYLILSLDELERACDFLNKIDIRILILGMPRTSQHSQPDFGIYCSNQYGQDMPALPPLFWDEYDSMFAGLV